MSNYPTINKPEKYNHPRELYLVDSDYFRGYGPQYRDKRSIKGALTKSFNYFKLAKSNHDKYGDRYSLDPIKHIEHTFGVRKIYNYNGDLIFESNSPIMIAFVNGLVTKEDIVKAIPW